MTAALRCVPLIECCPDRIPFADDRVSLPKRRRPTGEESFVTELTVLPGSCGSSQMFCKFTIRSQPAFAAPELSRFK